jgi:hypothetical protein
MCKKLVNAVLIGIALVAMAFTGACESHVAGTATTTTHVAPHLKGDDNGDGVIDEDESGWNCHTMGNHECGSVSQKS